MKLADAAWSDGRVLPVEQVVVSALDRAVLYGLGAFETVRLHGGRPFLLERHLARMQHSLAALHLDPPEALAGLSEGVVALADHLHASSALCRITVTAGAGPELAGVPGAGMRVIAHLRPAPEPPIRPARVGLAPYAHEARSPLSGVKSTSYLEHYLQRDVAERAGRVDDLLVDGHGHVTEATVSNVFGVLDGRLCTPPLSAGILPGVTRGVVLELAAELGLAVDERPLPVDELGSLQECFLTGAGKCLVDVDVLDGRPLDAERPVTAALKQGLVQRIARVCRVPVESVRF
jgi:branched-chain amino acid aminotransferase